MNQLRIQLINCTSEIIGWILYGDQKIARNLNIKVPKDFTENGVDIFTMSLYSINKNPDSQPWWSYLAIDIKKNVLVGNCGFKGEPVNGEVEIGYEVCRKLRNQGYATEMVKKLIRIALKSIKVHTILAHTTAEENPSVSVLKKCDFVFTKEVFDDNNEDKLWKWELKR